MCPVPRPSYQSQLIICLFAEEFDKETGQVLCGMDKLPPDLRQYVKDDNDLFEKEMKEWDVLQALKAHQETPLAEATAATPASATCSTITSPGSPQPWSIKSSPPQSQGQGKEEVVLIPVSRSVSQPASCYSC